MPIMSIYGAHVVDTKVNLLEQEKLIITPSGTPSVFGYSKFNTHLNLVMLGNIVYYLKHINNVLRGHRQELSQTSGLALAKRVRSHILS